MKKNFSQKNIPIALTRIIAIFALAIGITTAGTMHVSAAHICYSNGSCPISVDLSASKYSVGSGGNTDFSFTIGGIFSADGAKVIDATVSNGAWTGVFPTYGGTRTGNSGVLAPPQSITVWVENQLGDTAFDSVFISLITVNINFTSSLFLKELIAGGQQESSHI